MKLIYLIALVPGLAFACGPRGEVPVTSPSCSVEIAIKNEVEELTSSERDSSYNPIEVKRKGLRVEVRSDGFGGRQRSQTLLDEDGALTMTSLFNVWAANGRYANNTAGNTDIVTYEMNLLKAAVDLGLEYARSLSDKKVREGKTPEELAQLDSEIGPYRSSLEAMKAALNSAPRGQLPKKFVTELMGNHLQLINKGRRATAGLMTHLNRSIYKVDDKETLSGATQLCSNSFMQMRCMGPPIETPTSTGANFCNRDFATGERGPATPQCASGVAYPSEIKSYLNNQESTSGATTGGASAR